MIALLSTVLQMTAGSLLHYTTQQQELGARTTFSSLHGLLFSFIQLVWIFLPSFGVLEKKVARLSLYFLEVKHRFFLYIWMN